MAERRRARWRARGTATDDRIDRALQQRMLLLGRRDSRDVHDQGPAKHFSVLGSTGNVYEVEIGSLVTCTCPDALNGNACKHQLFVFLRVLRTPRDSELIHQRALLPGERERVFAAARRPVRGAVASASVRGAFAEATGQAPSAGRKRRSGRAPAAQEADAVPHRGGAGEACCICFEALGQEQLSVCRACRNAVHGQCFERWARARGGAITCPLCREPWAAKAPRLGGPRVSAEGYLNLGAQAGLPSERDESTYHY